MSNESLSAFRKSYAKKVDVMSDSKTYRVFVLNPGSTSTKLEYFENEKSIKKDNIFHDSTILRNFDTINAQLYYRME